MIRLNGEFDASGSTGFGKKKKKKRSRSFRVVNDENSNFVLSLCVSVNTSSQSVPFVACIRDFGSESKLRKSFSLFLPTLLPEASGIA